MHRVHLMFCLIILSGFISNNLHAESGKCQKAKPNVAGSWFDELSTWFTDFDKKTREFQRPNFSTFNSNTTFYEKEITGAMDQSFQLTLLTSDQADEIFSYLKQLDLHYERVSEGCFARAHYITRELEEMGILSGKVFHIAPDGQTISYQGNQQSSNTKWDYHVAPFILVSGKGGKIEKRVLDPSLFKKPVPIKKWIKNQVIDNKPFSDKNLFIKPRFAYTNHDKYASFWKWQLEDFEHMDEILEQSEQ
jgi:hypothetical protein